MWVICFGEQGNMTNLLYLNKGYNISMKREPEEEIITIPWQITLQYYRPLASGKRQTANRKPQLRVCSFALPRFQTLARRSVHFYLAKIQYNTRIHIGIVRLQGSPEETRRLYEA